MADDQGTIRFHYDDRRAEEAKMKLESELELNLRSGIDRSGEVRTSDMTRVRE